jgi:hypothetical protein
MSIKELVNIDCFLTPSDPFWAIYIMTKQVKSSETFCEYRWYTVLTTAWERKNNWDIFF